MLCLNHCTFTANILFPNKKDLPLIYSRETKHLSTPTKTSHCLLLLEPGAWKCKMLCAAALLSTSEISSQVWHMQPAMS